jgi:hypothetical protein
MYDEHEQLDLKLARLAQSLRSGEHMSACLQLAEFALKLDRCIRREERALSLAYDQLHPTTPRPLTSALAKVRGEHASLRRLVGLIASALDRADDRRGLEVIGKLRSVLLIHQAKEEALYPILQGHALTS